MTFFEVAAIIAPVISIMFAYFAFRRNQKTDDGQTAREMGTTLTEIGYIKSQMDWLIRKFERHEERYSALAERVEGVEQPIKSVHHRIDTIMDGTISAEQKGGGAK